ncbi:hypothetical protein PO909_001851 [Leuciscus waleckii]
MFSCLFFLFCFFTLNKTRGLLKKKIYSGLFFFVFFMTIKLYIYISCISKLVLSNKLHLT